MYRFRSIEACRIAGQGGRAVCAVCVLMTEQEQGPREWLGAGRRIGLDLARGDGKGALWTGPQEIQAMTCMTRRAFAATGLTAFAAGCAGVPMAQRKVAMRHVPPVRVDPGRIARVDVGLRPYRPTGFRVEREMLGETAIIHNYGHGGGGISLSWGTAHQAVEEGWNPDVSDYAVLGAGIVGLSTAMLLLERGANVTIYAKALSPETTSNVAGGQWWPASVYQESLVDAAYMARHVAAARFAFRRFQLLAGPEYGVSWEINYVLSNEPKPNTPAPVGHPLHEFVVNARDYAPGELSFASPHARSFDTMMVDTPYYLRVLERDIRLRGGRIAVKAFDDVSQVVALRESVVFNCTGLGAGALFGDTGIMPARGQLVILQPQAEVDYNILTGGHAYMFGRRDGVVLGGTFQKGNWSLEPSAEDTAMIMSENRALFVAVAGT